MTPQKVDLFAPIMALKKGPAPLVMRVGVQQSDMYTTVGTMTSPVKVESYILLSAMPDELRRKIETAIQSLVSGM